MITLIGVEFAKNSNKLYSYRVDPKQQLEIMVGDWVVVMAGQYKVVKVKTINSKPSDEELEVATKYVVNTLDVEPHKLRVKEARDDS